MTLRSTNPTRSFASHLRARRGFTLLELLVVIGIIALLVSITLGVALGVLRNREASVTRGLLTSLDRILEEYRISEGAIPPYLPALHENVPGEAVFQGDGEPNDTSSDIAFPEYRGIRHPRFPDAAVFLQQATGIAGVDDLIGSISDRFKVLTQAASTVTDAVANDPTPSIVDYWALEPDEWRQMEAEGLNPAYPVAEQQIIYYVHPDNRLAQDLFGQCVNGRPYFMSAGPDRMYGHFFEVEAEAALRIGSSDPDFAAKVTDLTDEILSDNIYSYEGVAGTHRKRGVEELP